MLKFLLRSAFRAVEAGYNTPKIKGDRGERRVHNALTSVLDEKDYRVLSDVVLRVPGGTTQIDHLLLSRFGIFVIETKNYSGWIFGGADQQKWTQVLKGGQRRAFQNPLRQNYAHLRAVQDALTVDPRILHNLVVFTGSAEPKTKMPAGVAWGLQDLGRKIALLQRKTVLSETEVKTFASRLSDLAVENTSAIQREHLANLERKTAGKETTPCDVVNGENDTPLCPRCNAKMVKRSNRKSGDRFWGCKAFPKCKGTRKATWNPCHS